MRSKYEAFLSSGYQDLAHELALVRSLLSEYAARFTDGVALPASDIERMAGLVDKISRVASRMARIENASELTAAGVTLLGIRIVQELEAEVGNERAAALWDRVMESALGLPAPQDVIEGASHGVRELD